MVQVRAIWTEEFYITVIRPTLEHVAQVWNGGISKGQSNEIDRIQKRALKIIYKEYDYNKAFSDSKNRKFGETAEPNVHWINNVKLWP